MSTDFAPSFFLLQQETFLVESSLASGLTALRNATLDDRGKFYTGFFQLSIGLERLFKLILVIDFMVSNRLRYPTNKWLRGFSHDLVRLQKATGQLPVASGVIGELERDSIEKHILVFLSKFAERSRYYNLDALTNVAQGPDPLAEWGKILEATVEQEVPMRRREQVVQDSKRVAKMLGRHVYVVAHDLEKRPLGLADAYRIPALQKLAAPYVLVRLFKILGPAREVLNELGHRAYSATKAAGHSKMHIPDMGDMLVFAADERAWIMRKKRWP